MIRIAAVSELPDFFLRISLTSYRFIVESRILPGIDKFRQCRRRVETDISVITDRNLPFLTRFRRHQNNAVCGTRTVDGCRRSILQYGNGFYIFRADIVQLAGDTVDQDQSIRFVAFTAKRTDTTHTDLTAAITRTSRTLDDGHTRHLSGQGIRQLRGRTVFEFLATDLGDRTDHVDLLFRTVADNDHFVQRLRVFGQLYGIVCFIAHNQFLRDVADI